MTSITQRITKMIESASKPVSEKTAKNRGKKLAASKKAADDEQMSLDSYAKYLGLNRKAAKRVLKDYAKSMGYIESAAEDPAMSHISISMSRDNAKLNVVIKDKENEKKWQPVLEKLGFKCTDNGDGLVGYIYPDGAKDKPAKDTISEWREKIKEAIGAETASVETAAVEFPKSIKAGYNKVPVTLLNKIPTKVSTKYSEILQAFVKNGLPLLKKRWVTGSGFNDVDKATVTFKYLEDVGTHYLIIAKLSVKGSDGPIDITLEFKTNDGSKWTYIELDY